MNEKAIEKLQYREILDILKGEASSQLTREMITELRPFSDIANIEAGLDETDEAVKLITSKGNLPVGNFYDIDSILNLAAKGGCLQPKQLLQVRYNLICAEKIVGFMKNDVPDVPKIGELVSLLNLDRLLSEDIGRAIVGEDKIANNASVPLNRIRMTMDRKNDEIKKQLNKYIGSKNADEILQENIVTMRGGRYVLPVKEAQRGKVSGIVHDKSSTGATLFIEPQAIVELNNQLRELEIQEQREIDIILYNFSERVAMARYDLMNNQDVLIKLDYINAKGRLSNLQKGERPNVKLRERTVLKEARHPLIDSSQVVPIDVEVGGRCRGLIITGPNTGGKTVTLKTVGLLSMMAQTGLNIPAASTSTIAVFNDILVDIGDEQSIEQSLSTFSSHMTNLVEILDGAGENTLVLLDELGAGTDPTEGAALAISILEFLRESKAVVIATTHYTELKKYALSTYGVENGGMEFDVETLSPTYRLLMGIPGKSNAFEISKKLGLKKSIIEHATSLIQGGGLTFDDVVSQIEENRNIAKAERDEAINLNIEVKRIRAEIELEKAKQGEKAKELLAKAKVDARNIIEEAENIANSARKEIASMQKAGLSIGEVSGLDRERGKLRKVREKYKETTVSMGTHRPVSIDKLQLGDRVKILSLDQIGEVIKLADDKKRLTVQVGFLKTRVAVDDIAFVDDGGRQKKSSGKAKKKNYASLMRTKTASASTSLSVRGQSLDEAIYNVEKYIDDSFMAGLEKVTVIHGRGEGILMRGIRERLRRNKHVESCKSGSYNEGGDGVTVVELKGR